VLDGNGEIDALRFGRRADHDADDRTLVVEQRSSGGAGLDGGLAQHDPRRVSQHC